MSRRRGAGSIFKQDGCSTWTIQFYKQGKRIREATGETDYQAARQILNRRLGAVAEGKFVERDRKPVLVSELYELLERHYRVNGRKSADVLTRRWKPKKPRSSHRTHLCGYFGDMAAQNVTTDLLEQYQDQRLKEGAANATINREMACLRAAFRLGFRKRRLTQLPLFPHLTENNVRTGFIEDAEYSKLTAGTTELWMRLFCELSFTYGFRKRELLGLRVGQCDLVSKTIRLEGTQSKNGQARELVMTSTVYELVKQASWASSPKITCSPEKATSGSQISAKRGTSWRSRLDSERCSAAPVARR